MSVVNTKPEGVVEFCPKRYQSRWSRWARRSIARSIRCSAWAELNPLNFPCAPFIGAAGLVNTLRGYEVTQGTTTVPIDAGINPRLIQASPAGAVTGPNTILAFPAVGDVVADLAVVTGQGTFANGSIVVMDSGPGIHNVKIDVKNWVRGATNLNRQKIGFSVAGINEATIPVTTPVQFDCRSWVQPVQLSVTFL